jgi:hypothetical protein
MVAAPADAETASAIVATKPLIAFIAILTQLGRPQGSQQGARHSLQGHDAQWKNGQSLADQRSTRKRYRRHFVKVVDSLWSTNC